MKTVFMDFASSVQLHIWVQWLKSTIWEQTPEGQPLWWITHLSILGLEKKDFLAPKPHFQIISLKKKLFQWKLHSGFLLWVFSGRFRQNDTEFHLDTESKRKSNLVDKQLEHIGAEKARFSAPNLHFNRMNNLSSEAPRTR